MPMLKLQSEIIDILILCPKLLKFLQGVFVFQHKNSSRENDFFVKTSYQIYSNENRSLISVFLFTKKDVIISGTHLIRIKITH